MIDDLGSASGLTRAQALQTLGSDVCEDERTALIDAALERARTPAARLALLHRMVYVHGQKPSIPVLARLASSGDPAMRLEALGAMRHLGPAAAVEALDAVLACARDPDLRLKVAAARALFTQYPKPPDAVAAAMGEMLRIPDQEARRAAIAILIELKNPSAATAGLVALATDRAADHENRRLAVRILGATGASEAIAPLDGLMRDPDRALRREAAAALAELAKKNKNPALRAPLRRARDDLDRQVKIAGVTGLARLGDVAEVMPLLKRLLWTHDKSAQSDAIALAGELGPAAAPVVPELIGLVHMPQEMLIESMQSDGREERRREAEQVLEQLGASALPAVVQRLKSPNEEVRLEGLWLLWMVSKHAAPLSGTLTGLVGNRSEPLRLSAVGLLGEIAKNGDSRRRAAAVGPIAGRLSDKSRDVRLRAAQVLGELGPAAAPAAGKLAAALDEKDAEMALAVIEALGKIGPPARGAGAALRRAADDKRGTVRMAAAQALVQTGADEPRGLRLLLEAFDPPKRPADWEVSRPDAAPASPLDAGRRLAVVVGPKTSAELVLPVATKALASTDYYQRENGAKMIEGLRRAAAPALPTVVDILAHHQNNPVPDEILCRTIGGFGADAVPHLAVLIDQFKRAHIKACGDALVAIARERPEVVARIQDGFRNECPRPYGPANELLAAIGAKPSGQ